MAAKPELAPSITAQTIKAAQEALNNAPSMSDAPGVDKIRELLFGNQMQDYDRRFAVMEERFLQKVRDLEAESARALQSMESSMKKQLESLASQIRQEQDLRAEADKEPGPRPSGTDPGIGEAPHQGRRPTGQPGPGLHGEIEPRIANVARREPAPD